MCCEPMFICDPYDNTEVASWTYILSQHFLKFLLNLYAGCNLKMGSVPQGMFAAYKVRAHVGGHSEQFGMTAASEQAFPPSKLLEHLPPRYNSKLMNSIWGLYNRYSVHNVKQHIDRNAAAL